MWYWVIGVVSTVAVVVTIGLIYTVWENMIQSKFALLRNFFLEARCKWLAQIIDDGIIIGKRRKALKMINEILTADEANRDLLIERIIKPIHAFGEQLIENGEMEEPTRKSTIRVTHTADIVVSDSEEKDPDASTTSA